MTIVNFLHFAIIIFQNARYIFLTEIAKDGLFWLSESREELRQVQTSIPRVLVQINLELPVQQK
jgi:hypothetical protein